MIKAAPLFTFSFCLGLLGALAMGYAHLLTAEATRMAGWVETTGVLSEITVEKKFLYYKPIGYRYFPKPKYRYRVGGSEYVGKRLGPLREYAGSPDTVRQWLAPILADPDGPWPFTADSGGQSCRLKAVAQPIPVYYNPDHPGDSVLDRTDTSRGRTGLATGLVLVLLGTGGALAALVLSLASAISKRAASVFRRNPVGRPEPQDWIAWGREADQQLVAGHVEKALEGYHQAIHLNWGEPGTLAGLADHQVGKGKCLILLGRFQEALDPLDAAIHRYEQTGSRQLAEARRLRNQAAQSAPKG